MSKIYRTPLAVLRAAQSKLGGRITAFDERIDVQSKTGLTYALAVNITNLSGRIEQDFLSPHEAAKRAGLNYQPGHGGKREGAGRPSSPEVRKIRKTITLSSEHLDYLKSLDANLSLAIRKLIDQHRK